MTEVGEAGRRGEAHVAGADHGDGGRRLDGLWRQRRHRGHRPGSWRPRRIDKVRTGSVHSTRQCLDRRSSGSWWSGSRGIPPRRRAALSSTELAGRGAGRGGCSSAVAMGSTMAGSKPGRRDHVPGELEPRGRPLVGHVEEPRATGHPQSQEHPGQVLGEGRAASLVVHEAQRPAPGRQAQHRLDHVGAVRAAHPGGAHHGRAGQRPTGPPVPRPACCGRRPTAGWAGPTRCRARRGRRRRRSRWTATPGGRPSRQPPRPRGGRRGR